MRSIPARGRDDFNPIGDWYGNWKRNLAFGRAAALLLGPPLQHDQCHGDLFWFGEHLVDRRVHQRTNCRFPCDLSQAFFLCFSGTSLFE
jgi:hypothetical protein